MNDKIDNIELKKRLMFVKGDDYYYLTYNIIIILQNLDCYYKQRIFRDYRKLSFLIEFVSDYNLINIINNKKNLNSINIIDRELLTRAYSNGLLRKGQLLRLLFTLEKKDYIILEKENNSNIINVSLNEKSLPKNIFRTEHFEAETNNLVILKGNIQRINRISLDTLLTKLFVNFGVKTWAV
jgi:hypothetical protein